MKYVDGYVLLVPKNKIETYKKMALDAGKMWMKHGALQVFECVGEDLECAEKWGCLPFPKMTKAKSDEAVLYSFIVYESRAHRDEINAQVTQDMEKNKEKFEKAYKDVFDMKKMAVGGFETIVNLEK